MRLKNWIICGCLAGLLACAPRGAVIASGLNDYGPVTNSGSAIQRLGSVAWMDLLTTDVRAAAAFYSRLFGWAIDISADGSYAYARLDGVPVAAFAAFEDVVEDEQSLWLPSLSVADVDAAVSEVQSAGGTLLEGPEDLPGRGRYALVQDPAGAPFMLLRAVGGDPARTKLPGRWLWSELWTNDVAAATAFYGKVIGYRIVTLKGRDGSVFVVMGRDNIPYASVTKAPLPDVEPNWLSFLLVDDVDATARRVLEFGGAVIVPPQKDGLNDDIAIVADPTGGVFALQQKETGE